MTREVQRQLDAWRGDLLSKSQLRSAAIRAHHDGTGWFAFHGQYVREIAACEPWDLRQQSVLARELSLLVTSGDLDGHRAVGDWWEDDAKIAYPASDDTTVAKLQLSFPEVRA